MAIRLPLKTVGQFTETNELGVNSVAGGIAHPFLIPQDTDGLVVKFTASCAGAGYSVTLQTSDDGGTTYYDVARSSVVSNANNTTAEWLAAPVFGFGTQNVVTSVVAVGSVQSASRTIGSAGASTLGTNTMSGLPVLGVQNRVFVRITGNVTSAAANTAVTTVYANSQSVAD